MGWFKKLTKSIGGAISSPGRALSNAFDQARSTGGGAYQDISGKIIKSVAAPISSVSPTAGNAIENGLNKANTTAGNLVDFTGDNISQAARSPDQLERSVQGITVRYKGGGGEILGDVGGALGSAAGAISDVFSDATRTGGAFVDATGKVVKTATAPVSQAITDVAKATEKGMEDTGKLAKSLGKETTGLYKIGTDYAKGVGKGQEMMYSGLLKGDFKRFGKGALEYDAAVQKAALESTKAAYKPYLDIARESGKASGFKDLEEASRNVQREGEKAVDILGPLVYNGVLDYLSAGTYGVGKTAAQSMSEKGLSGALDKKVLEDAAIAYIANKFGGGEGWQKNLTPENLKAARELAAGDLEKALYEKAGIDSNMAKDIRIALQEGKNVADSIKNAAMKYQAKKLGMDENATKAILSGNISTAVSSLAKSQLAKNMPASSKEMLNMLNRSMSLKDMKKLAADSAGDYLGINPKVLQMADQTIKNPRAAALQALSQNYGIDPTMYQNIRNMTSGDLRASAMQGLGDLIGVHPSETQLLQNITNGDYRSGGLKALGDSLGIPPEYLQVGQQLSSKESPETTLGEFDEIPIKETRQEVEKQTNNLEEARKSGKKMSEIVGSNPEAIRQYFWKG